MKLYVGIDQSINSTGVTFRTEDNMYLKFCQITDTKKTCSSSVQNLIYQKDNQNTGNYTHDDLTKILNAERLALVIFKQIKKHYDLSKSDDIEVRIEGPIMQSFKQKASRVNDLVAFGTLIKFHLIKKLGISRVHVIAPTQLKKLFTGKGNCKKERIEEVFYELNPKYDKSKGKNDDIADSFGLSYVNLNKNKKV